MRKLPSLLACVLALGCSVRGQDAPTLPDEASGSDIVSDGTVVADSSTVPPTAAGRLSNVVKAVDILMAYTPAARVYAGGANAMRAAIYSHIALANRCYANSDIPIVLRPAAIVETNYTEVDFNTDLTRLGSPADGYMDELPRLRNTYGADLLALIRRDAFNGIAGLAYVNSPVSSSFSPYACSVTADVWASGNIAFPHEVGHNFGCWHDRQNSAGVTDASAYGWRFNGNDGVQYITVMAYYPGTRIPYFSNPTILYQGQPTGVASGATAADNAMRHEVSKDVTASFRPGKNHTDFDGNGTPDLLWTDTSTGVRRLWLMSGTGPRIGMVELGTIPTNWALNGAADFDGNGTPDLIWTDTSTGVRRLWLMNGTGPRIGMVELGTIPTNWVINGAADFDGNGTPDLIWTDTSTGVRRLWLMNGTGPRIGMVELGTIPTNWVLNGASDFDGNGTPDLIWTDTTTGVRRLWLMNGTGPRIGMVELGTVPTNWVITGAADFDGNGTPDLIWTDTSTGVRRLWLMNGTGPRIGMVELGTVPTNWVIGNR